MSNPYFDKAIEINNRVATANGLEVHQAMYEMACAQMNATLAIAHEQRVANDLKRIELAHTLMRHHTSDVDYSEEINQLAGQGFDALFTSEYHHVYNSAGESIDGTEHTDLRDWVTARLGLGETK